ncbi:uncharacterized protein LOC119283440 [Triticum dicoccoides]|uniref:uncharacterized protein LOC119283440 n=1 Tax=Triticum dicoccoides TaxID=85692 RepID=UPI00188FEA86|nr:uncharacterized protein LOC119283440 [Triticum dicoccoides]
MKFDLPNIIKRREDLDQLTAPFSRQEIDNAIKEMPADRAPGPDGFMGHFIKSCWHIIKEDFYRLCDQFHEGTLNLESINEGFITLIPKVYSPETVNDFRPITLLNCCLKVITKLLANRLQKIILKIVHHNQYGFIKRRTIQDCLAWAFEYIHQFQTSKQKIVLLKLDFAKAFDTIQHGAMLQIMKHMGFIDKWLSWIKNIFSSIGLKINFHKSTLIPINCDDDLTSELAGIFECTIGNMPFTYLGLPLRTNKPSIQDLMPLVCSVERRMTSTLAMMSYGAKLSLVNTVITSLTIFALCTLKFPPKILELLDKIRRKCWSTYYSDKIPHASDPCGSFWWRDVLKLTPIYRGISKVEIYRGDKVLMWKDLWLEDILSDSHPRAFSFARNEDISVQQFLTITSLDEAFHLPLSMQARDEVRNIQHLVAHVTLDNGHNIKDVWSYIWGTTEYAARRFYKFCFRNVKAHKTYHWLWKSKVTVKIKVFGWLLLSDRLNTRDMLKRRHYNVGDDLSCLLCGHAQEDVDHMILNCPFSKHCWSRLGMNPEQHTTRLPWLETAKKNWNKPMFMEAFIQASWSIWKERNDKLFRQINPSYNSWLDRFKTDFGLLQYRVKENMKDFIFLLLDSLPSD